MEGQEEAGAGSGRMTVPGLCDGIGLQEAAKARVLDFCGSFDFAGVEPLLLDFRDYGRMDAAYRALRTALGEDGDGMKVLSCMLRASAGAHALYREKNIGDRIYFDTMGCFTRFVGEAERKTGRLCFDRGFWTVRQAGLHLFRLGQLEYEVIPSGSAGNPTDRTAIGLHIPSGCDLSPRAVDDSLAAAGAFFKRHFPELAGCTYQCHSWLMDAQLASMLKVGSNILRFQDRFEVFDRGKPDTEFIGWVFGTDTDDYGALPEDTSLQRSLKRHLLGGGSIHSSFARLKAAD